MLAGWLSTQSKGGAVALVVSAIVVFAAVPGRLRLLVPTLAAVALVAPQYHGLTAAFRADGADAAARHAGGIALALFVAGVAVGGVYALLDNRLTVPARARRVAAIAVAAGATLAAGVGVVQVAEHVDDPRDFVSEKWESFKQLPTTETGSSHLLSLGSNRYDFWRVSLAGFADHPVAGIGGRGFGAGLPAGGTQHRDAGAGPLAAARRAARDRHRRLRAARRLLRPARRRRREAPRHRRRGGRARDARLLLRARVGRLDLDVPGGRDPGVPRARDRARVRRGPAAAASRRARRRHGRRRRRAAALRTAVAQRAGDGARARRQLRDGGPRLGAAARSAGDRAAARGGEAGRRSRRRRSRHSSARRRRSPATPPSATCSAWRTATRAGRERRVPSCSRHVVSTRAARRSPAPSTT